MVTDITKKLIEQYLTLTIWYMIHQDDKDISTGQFEGVLEEIGCVENDLRANGVSEAAIQKMLNYAEELYKTPIDRLSPNAQLRMCKIIFGAGTHWSADPHPLSKASEKGENAKAM